MLHVVVVVQPPRELQSIQTHDDAGQDKQQLIGRGVMLVLAVQGQPALQAAPDVNRVEELVERIQATVMR
jgi:hypothetical protein